MKVVILAGGFGTRLAEETGVRPKPMVEVGNRPILWHVMKIYSAYNIRDFIICCGYKGEVIKAYFTNYLLNASDVTFHLINQTIDFHRSNCEDWSVTLVDTGINTMTGGRLRRVREMIGDETFCFTYGDGVGNVDIGALISLHKRQGTAATMTATQPPGRFGTFTLTADETKVRAFREKPKGDGAWVNGGFFVLEPKVMDYISSDSTVWEHEPLQGLAHDGELSAYRHDGFWQPMDTLRDKEVLEKLWQSGSAPWKVW